MTSKQNPLAKEALNYFYPVRAIGKHPIDVDFLQDRTGQRALQHDDNIAILTGEGAYKREDKVYGLLIVDSDQARPGEINGVEEWNKLCWSNEGIQALDFDTVIDQSGSGGNRHYFLTNENMKISKKRCSEFKAKYNIDILYNGKCCMYPGSIYPGCIDVGNKKKDPTNPANHKCKFVDKCLNKGNKYKWIKPPQHQRIQYIPLWLLRMIEGEDKTKEYASQPLEHEFTDDDRENVRKMLELIKDDAWDDRDGWMTAVWSLHSFGFSFDEIDTYSRKSVKKYTDGCVEEILKQFNDKYKYSYGKNSSFFKWASQHLKDGKTVGDLNCLIPFWPSSVKLSADDIKFIRKRYSEDVWGLTEILNRFYCNDNVRVTTNDGFIYCWDSEDTCYRKTLSTLFYNKICNVAKPILNEFLSIMKTEHDKDASDDKQIKKEQKEQIQTINNLIKKLNRRQDLKIIVESITTSSLEHYPNFEKILDKNKEELPIRDNKVLNFKTWEIRDRTKQDYWSDYCPVAITENKESIKWAKEHFLTLADGDKDLMKCITYTLGYCMTGFTHEKKAIIIYGERSNTGKSFTSKLMRTILNHFCTPSQKKLLYFHKGKSLETSHTAELDKLKYSRLVIISEASSDDSINPHILKTITGGDPITGRECHGKAEYCFETQAKPMTITNDNQGYDPGDEATVKRLHALPFNHVYENIPEADAYCNSLLSGEKLDALFTVLAFAARNYIRSGQPLPTCEAMITLKKEQNQLQDNIEDFIEDYCIVHKDAKCKKIDLWTAYAKSNDKKRSDVKGRNYFYSRLADLGYKDKETKTDNLLIITGISLKEGGILGQI